MNANLQWGICNSVFIVISDEGTVDDYKWSELLSDIKKSNVSSYIGIAFGNTITSPTQRSMMFDILKSKNVKTVLVTDSSITRGFATIASWFNVKVTAFPHNGLEDAIATLISDQVEFYEIVLSIKKLKEKMPKNSSNLLTNTRKFSY